MPNHLERATQVEKDKPVPKGSYPQDEWYETDRVTRCAKDHFVYFDDSNLDFIIPEDRDCNLRKTIARHVWEADGSFRIMSTQEIGRERLAS